MALTFDVAEQKKRLRNTFPNIKETGNCFYLQQSFSGYTYDLSMLPCWRY